MVWTKGVKPANGVVVLQNLQKGAKVRLLGYTGKPGYYNDEKRCFQVETDAGNIGFVHYSAVCPADSLAKMAKMVPEIYLNKPHGVTATCKWLERHAVVGKTTIEEVDGEWWGVPLAVCKSGGTIKKYYPVNVMYENRSRDGLWLTFTGGTLSAVAFAAEHEVYPWLSRIVIATQSSDFVTRLHAHRISGGAANVDGNGWFMNWIVLPLLTVLTWLGWFLYFFTLTNFAGMLVHWWGYMPFVGWLLPLVLTLASALATLAAAIFWEYSTAMLVCAGIMFVCNGLWFDWCKWNYCYRCRRFFTKDKYGKTTSEYDEYEDWDEHKITTRTTTYADGHKEEEVLSDAIKNRWRDKIHHRHDTYYMVCRNCGKKSVIKEHSESTTRSKRDK